MSAHGRSKDGYRASTRIKGLLDDNLGLGLG